MAAALRLIRRHSLRSATDLCPSYTGRAMPCDSALFLHSGEQTQPKVSMHCGQMGFWQIMQRFVANCPKCFVHSGAVAAAVGSAGGREAATGFATATRTTGG